MKSKTLLLIVLFSAFTDFLIAQNATEIIKKAEQNAEGKSNYTEMTMTIVRPKWKRTIAFKSVSIENVYSMTLITAPTKEVGQTFMKRENELWSWSPAIKRFVKLPASLMSQGWMGSDFSNDDLMKKSSLSEDYNHKLLGSETISGEECYKIELVPKNGVNAFWGKIEMWVSKSDYLQLKTKYYDEDLELVRGESASEVKTMGGRKIPTYFELIPADEPGNKTIVELKKIIFNPNVPKSFFSQQNMKKGSRLIFPIK